MGRPKKNNPKFKVGDNVKIVGIDGYVYSNGVIDEVLYDKGKYQYKLENNNIVNENELKLLQK